MAAHTDSEARYSEAVTSTQYYGAASLIFWVCYDTNTLLSKSKVAERLAKSVPCDFSSCIAGILPEVILLTAFDAAPMDAKRPTTARKDPTRTSKSPESVYKTRSDTLQNV